MVVVIDQYEAVVRFLILLVILYRQLSHVFMKLTNVRKHLTDSSIA